jgi:PAS domain S-box-containing protein
MVDARSRSSARRIVLLTLCFAVPLLLLVYVEVRSTLRATEESATRRGIAAAKLGATALDEYVRGVSAYADAYSRNPALLEGVRRNDEQRVRQVLAELVQHNPRVDRAFVTDPKGIEWGGYPYESAVLGLSFAYRDWYRGVTRQESTYVSAAYERAAGRQERTIAVATPLRPGPGAADGYLVLQMLASSLEHRLESAAPAGFGRVIVLDREHSVIVQVGPRGPEEPSPQIASRVPCPPSGRIVTQVELQGERYLVAAAAAPSLGGCVLAVRDLRVAVAAATTLSRVVYALAFAIAFLLAVFVQTLLARRGRRIEEQAATSLRESERRFRGTFEQAAGIAHFSARGEFLRANQKLSEILGFSGEELLRKNLRDLIRPEDFVGGEGCPEGEVLQRLGEWKEGICRLERELLRGDGTRVWCHLTIAPVTDEQGETEYFTAVIEDIHERKRLEEQFLHSQKMRAIGQLAGGVAHDFNNLLTTILGYTELLQRRLSPEDPLRAYVDEIGKAGERASALTSQLLAFGRKQVLRPVPIDLNEIVGGMETLLRRLVGERIEIETNLDPDLGAVKADPNQVEQVLMNLVVNARDAMPRGGRIRIETARELLREGEVQVDSGLTPGSYATLSVTDTGVGMDPATQAKLFEPFFTTKEKGKGTGLGLSTVYGIVKQSGGAITVRSEPGEGSTFRVYLPHADGEAPVAREPTPTSAGTARATETILLVEDDGVLRSLTRRVLEEHGYTVLEGGDGEEAIARCEGHSGPIDALLTDIVMPGISGARLAERVRSVHPEAKVIFVSGYTGEALVPQSVRESGVLFLPKPYTPAILIRTIRRALETRGPVVRM